MENPLEKSDDHVPPPYEFFGPVGLPVARNSENFEKFGKFVKILKKIRKLKEKNMKFKNSEKRCFLNFKNFEKFPLENPLEKSDDHVPPL